MDKDIRKLVIAAIAEAADVMDSVDPDDRTVPQRYLVQEVKVWITLANAGDKQKADLIVEAVPSWKQQAEGERA